MRAFTKIDGAPIGDRSVVARAGIVVYLDETLLDDSWDAELADGGLMLLNTRRAVQRLEGSIHDAHVLLMQPRGHGSANALVHVFQANRVAEGRNAG